MGTSHWNDIYQPMHRTDGLRPIAPLEGLSAGLITVAAVGTVSVTYDGSTRTYSCMHRNADPKLLENGCLPR